MTKIRIDELLQQCTVKLSVLETGKVGTGFFVAPGYILTCGHVVQGDQTCSVRYRETENFAMAEVVERWAAWDMALLAFETTENLPCVMLDGALQPGDDLFLFGYPERDFPNGCPVTTSHEGITPGPPREIKFKAGQITPGMSGSPLLNQRTGKVCGMVTFTRDERTDLGGGAVPADDILTCLSEEVKQANREFHQRDSRWRDALPKAEATNQPSIQQSIDGSQNIVVGSTSGNTNIIGVQNIKTILPMPGPLITGIPTNLQERGSRTFVDRDQTLQELHGRLQTSQTLAITALQGMGGIGKTEIAVQYAQRYKEQYPSGVCWLSARGAEVGTQLVNFAVTVLGLPQPDGELVDQVQSVWNRWPRQDDGERVLLIYDDVADYEDIEGLLPTDERFQVLVTTRLQNLAAGVEDFRLELLSKAAALELLRKIVDGAGTTRIDMELTIAEALCERVGYLPLGLELLGYFLKNKPRMSLEKLQQRLEKNRLNAKAFEAAHPGMTAKLGVYEAFELSWAELSGAGQEMACWLSLFGLAPIPWGLASAGVGEDERDEWDDTRDDELLKLSLLQDLGGDSYQLHQLVREFLLAKLEEQASKDALKESYGKLMVGIANQMPQSPTQELIAQLSPIVPHMEEVVTRWQNSLGNGENELISPFVFLARFYGGQGAYAQAEPWYENSLKATLERFGEAHPDVASSVNNLAGLYCSQGRYGEAEPLYLQALALRKQLLGEAHPDVASSVNNLAALYHSQGRYEEAEPLYLQALALRKQQLGEAHPDVATSVNNLAGLYESQGRYEEAEPLYLQALALWKQQLGEAHPDVATSVNNLAALYGSQGRYEEAEPLYLQALALTKQLLGEAHPDVAGSLNNLAELYRSQGRYEEAEPLYLEALALRKQLLGEAHPDVAASLNNLAILYYSQGRYEAAEPLYLEALALWKQLLGEAHPSVATSLNNLAELYRSQDRYEAAEPLYLEALALQKQLLGEAHPDVARSLNNLAVLYANQQLYYDSECLFRQALDLQIRLLGQEHPDTQNTWNSYITLISEAIQANQADTLADHPMTQDLIPKIRAAMESQDHPP